jgi:hypothetical protein
VSTSFSRRVHAARFRGAQPQTTGPDIELHRIVFARRKTAGATSPLELTPRTRVEQRRKTPKRDRPEPGRSGQRIARRQALKGTKTSREAPGHSTCDACDSATFIKSSRGGLHEIGPVMSGWSGRCSGRERADWFGRPEGDKDESTPRRRLRREHDAARDETGEEASQRQPESKTVGESQYGRRCPGLIIRPEPNARGRWTIESVTIRSSRAFIANL